MRGNRSDSRRQNTLKMSRPFVTAAIIASLAITTSEAANCNLIPPLEGKQGVQYGLVFNPGAGIPGMEYASLAGKIQDLFPGELWVGLIHSYAGDLPNNVEIANALKECSEAAE